MGTSLGNVTAPKKTFFKHGDFIMLKLDQANWFEGEVVSGELSFNVTNKCPAVEVSVVLDGFEYVEW